jgi:hypothetical protein
MLDDMRSSEKHAIGVFLVIVAVLVVLSIYGCAVE